MVDLRDGFRKTIVSAEGERLVLEDGSGNHVKANISEVAPGRQKSNISYNYLGTDAGRWIWATPHAAALGVAGGQR